MFMFSLPLDSSGTLVKFSAVKAGALACEQFTSAMHTPPPWCLCTAHHVHLLGQSLRFDEDVEVGLLQLLSDHGKDGGCGAELSQVVDNELEEQLKAKRTLSNEVWKHTKLQGGNASPQLVPGPGKEPALQRTQGRSSGPNP